MSHSNLGRAALSLCALSWATAGSAAVGDPRLDGFWNIDEAARRAVQEGPRAELTATGQAIARRGAEAQAQRIARGEVVQLNGYTCGLLGVPFFVNTSEPWLLSVTDDQVTQVFERYLLTPRRFYTDGRSLPDVSKMPPSSSGYSVARWEGRELVIVTRGLPAGGTDAGGLKGPSTTLTERVRVDDGGDRLSWTFSFADPTLMAKPHSYTIEYDRAPKHTFALTQYCDPTDSPALIAEEPPQQAEIGR